jgi:hypothetical protein
MPPDCIIFSKPKPGNFVFAWFWVFEARSSIPHTHGICRHGDFAQRMGSGLHLGWDFQRLDVKCLMEYGDIGSTAELQHRQYGRRHFLEPRK